MTETVRVLGLNRQDALRALTKGGVERIECATLPPERHSGPEALLTERTVRQRCLPNGTVELLFARFQTVVTVDVQKEQE